MSSGVPQRPSGIFAAMRCFTAGSSALPYAVSIQPGPSTFTRIRGATECASARLKEYTPPFAEHLGVLTLEPAPEHMVPGHVQDHAARGGRASVHQLHRPPRGGHRATPAPGQET